MAFDAWKSHKFSDESRVNVYEVVVEFVGSPFPSSWFRQIAEVHVQAEAERGKGSSKKPDWGSPRIPYQLEVVIHHRALRTDNDLFPGRWCWDALWFLGSGVDAMTRRSKLERERRKTAARSQSNEERDPLILVWVVALHTNNGLFPGRRCWSAGWIVPFCFALCCLSEPQETLPDYCLFFYYIFCFTMMFCWFSASQCPLFLDLFIRLFGHFNV